MIQLHAGNPANINAALAGNAYWSAHLCIQLWSAQSVAKNTDHALNLTDDYSKAGGCATVIAVRMFGILSSDAIRMVSTV